MVPPTRGESGATVSEILLGLVLVGLTYFVLMSNTENFLRDSLQTLAQHMFTSAPRR